MVGISNVNVTAARDSDEYPKEDLWHPVKDQRGVRKIIESWMSECKKNAAGHLQKSKQLRGLHYGLSVMSIVAGALASVMSVVYSSANALQQPEWVGVMAAITSGVSTATMAVLTVLDPSARRLTHLTAELNYSLLARDLGVYIMTEREEDFEEWRVDAIRFQRRIDNAQAVAPPL